MKEKELMEDPSQTTVALKIETSRLCSGIRLGRAVILEILGVREALCSMFAHWEKNKELVAEEEERECYRVELALVSGSGLKESVDLPEQRILIVQMQLDKKH